MDEQGMPITVELRALLQAGREMQHAVARALGVGVNDLRAMDHLASSPGPVGPAELGHWLGIQSASVTVLVDRLAAAGHLRREPHPDDRRRVTLRMTDTARKGPMP